MQSDNREKEEREGHAQRFDPEEQAKVLESFITEVQARKYDEAEVLKVKARREATMKRSTLAKAHNTDIQKALVGPADPARRLFGRAAGRREPKDGIHHFHDQL